MAMPPGNVVLSDKMQFPAATGGGIGNEIHQQQHHRHQWFHVDERDGFISWLRGEFAAANAIIDSLCHHLRAVGEPGEYDAAIGCIQQRRCNWNPVLHMQQYFSVGEVIFALQQVALRKQQQQQPPLPHQQHHRYFHDQPKYGVKEYKRASFTGFNKGQRGFGGEAVKPAVYSSVETANSDGNSSKNVESEVSEEIKSALSEDEKDASAKPNVDNNLKSSGNSEGNLSDNLEAESETVGALSSPKENDSHSSQNQNGKQNRTVTPKTLVGSEIIDGKTVNNVVDGLKLYESVLDDVEVSKLVSLVNDLRAVGRRGQFQGQTYVVSKRPMRGRGREMIQLGLPIADEPLEDENPAATSKDRRCEPIPTFLEDVIERFVGMQIMTVKPDACIIDIYNEGDHSQPHLWPSWFGKPISMLSLTECDLTFGRVITADHPGNYKGSLKLPLAPGSLLVMQGKSTDFSRYAIPSMRKQRILVTFTKYQPKKFAHNDSQRLTSPATGLSSHWGPPPSRSPNHIRHSAPKHYSAIPTAGVLPAPATRPQIPAPNGVQPLFVTAPVAAPMPFPAPVPLPPVSAGWAAPPPRHPPNRLPVPVPGTGVFLPPSGSSGNASAAPKVPAVTEMNFHVETAAYRPDKENGPGKSNSGNGASSKEISNGKSQRKDCNGIGDVKEEQHQNVDDTVGNKPAGAV